LYEIVLVKKQNRYCSQRAITGTYFLLVTVKIYIYLKLDILLIFFMYCAHHQHFTLTTGYFNWKIYDQIYFRNQEPGLFFRYCWVLHRVNIDTCTLSLTSITRRYVSDQIKVQAYIIVFVS